MSKKYPNRHTGGLKCPGCNSSLSRVIRTTPKWGTVARRRRCEHCGQRWTTYEAATKS